jgi:hypothetical protein
MWSFCYCYHLLLISLTSSTWGDNTQTVEIKCSLPSSHASDCKPNVLSRETPRGVSWRPWFSSAGRSVPSSTVPPHPIYRHRPRPGPCLLVVPRHLCDLPRKRLMRREKKRQAGAEPTKWVDSCGTKIVSTIARLPDDSKRLILKGALLVV